MNVISAKTKATYDDKMLFVMRPYLKMDEGKREIIKELNVKTKEAYEKYENVIFSAVNIYNIVLSMMAGLALQEGDIGYSRFLSNKAQSISHTLEIDKYNKHLPKFDVMCAGKDLEGTYKVVKQLLANIDTG